MKPNAPMPTDIKVIRGLTVLLWLVGASLVVGAAGLWLVRHAAWSVQTVVVVGDIRHQSEALLRSHLAHRLSGTFINMDLQHVQHVVEELPWVRQAVVQRVFPQHIQVDIEEHVGVAWWGEANAGRLVNQQGELFEAVADAEYTHAWPELIGPDGLSEPVWHLWRVIDPLFEGLRREVVKLELDNRGAWRIQLDNGAHIELGRGSHQELLLRTQQFTDTVSTLSSRYGQRELESADLRYPNGYALRLRGVTTVVPTAVIPS